MPFKFKLELADGTPAKPATFATGVPTWRVGDSVFISPGVTYRVTSVREDPDGREEWGLLVVEPVD